MKTCPKCSAENDDKRTVCLECGDNISAVIPSFGVSKPKLNESAGASAPQITRFKAPAPRKQLKKPSPWKSLFSLRSLIAWAFLAALVYAFYLALTPLKNDADLPTQGTARDTHASYEITHIPTQESSISTLPPPLHFPKMTRFAQHRFDLSRLPPLAQMEHGASAKTLSTNFWQQGFGSPQ